MKLSYGADDICQLVRQHAAEHNPFRPGYAETADLQIRDSDGGLMTDDCEIIVEVELGEITLGENGDPTAPTASTSNDVVLGTIM